MIVYCAGMVATVPGLDPSAVPMDEMVDIVFDWLRSSVLEALHDDVGGVPAR